MGIPEEDHLHPGWKSFLKRKKQWKSGRTIIAYHKVVHRLLFKAVAILLGEIAADTWKRSWGIQPTPRIWQNIKQYFDNTDDTVTLAFHNDDLVGFFNSVPQDQVCAAATTRIIHMEDIMTIVKSSFQGMHVQVGTLIVRQVHGTAIGSQLSPALSHICVARHEVIWQRIYGQWYTSHNVFLERYVGNRLVIFPSPSSGHPAPPLEALLQADFYSAPIVLEQVGSSESLGFVIDVGDRSIYYKNLADKRSLSILLSGARSRSALATKYVHPARAVQMALDQLRSIYLSAGYKSADLQHLFHLQATPTRKNPQAPAFLVLYLHVSAFVFLVFLVSLFLDVRVDPGAHTLVQTVLHFLRTSASCRHARPHDSASSPHDSERW